MAHNLFDDDVATDSTASLLSFCCEAVYASQVELMKCSSVELYESLCVGRTEMSSLLQQLTQWSSELRTNPMPMHAYLSELQMQSTIEMESQPNALLRTNAPWNIDTDVVTVLSKETIVDIAKYIQHTSFTVNHIVCTISDDEMLLLSDALLLTTKQILSFALKYLCEMNGEKGNIAYKIYEKQLDEMKEQSEVKRMKQMKSDRFEEIEEMEKSTEENEKQKRDYIQTKGREKRRQKVWNDIYSLIHRHLWLFTIAMILSLPVVFLVFIPLALLLSGPLLVAHVCLSDFPAFLDDCVDNMIQMSYLAVIVARLCYHHGKTLVIDQYEFFMDVLNEKGFLRTVTYILEALIQLHMYLIQSFFTTLWSLIELAWK